MFLSFLMLLTVREPSESAIIRKNKDDFGSDSDEEEVRLQRSESKVILRRSDSKIVVERGVNKSCFKTFKEFLTAIKLIFTDYKAVVLLFAFSGRFVNQFIKEYYQTFFFKSEYSEYFEQYVL